MILKVAGILYILQIIIVYVIIAYFDTKKILLKGLRIKKQEKSAL